MRSSRRRNNSPSELKLHMPVKLNSPGKPPKRAKPWTQPPLPPHLVPRSTYATVIKFHVPITLDVTS
jgi:hypothetical protein